MYEANETVFLLQHLVELFNFHLTNDSNIEKKRDVGFKSLNFY